MNLKEDHINSTTNRTWEESLEKQNRAVFVFFFVCSTRGEEGETTRKIQLFLFDWLSFF